MNIIVSGGAGFIGSTLVDRLMASGHAVTVVDNLSGGDERFLAHHRDSPRFRLVVADVRNTDRLIAAMGSNATNYNLARYLLDPMPSDAMNGASLWDMNHQQAHDDAANFFGVQPSLTLIDSPTQRAGPFQWFLFTNSQEHNALNQAALAFGHDL